MKGRCLICGALGPLTRDHVPPKGVVPPREVEIRRLTAHLSGKEDAGQSPRRYRSSPSFPTLCATCNGALLGSEYDPHLAKLANDVSSWVRAAFTLHLSLPGSFDVRFKPQRVGRAIAGHLLAAEERKDPVAPLNQADLPRTLRAYFLDPTALLPPTVFLHMWPYAAEEFVMVRGFGAGEFNAEGTIVGDILKFFPLAFYMVGLSTRGLNRNATKLPLDAVGLDEEVTLSVSLRNVPRTHWPEYPIQNEMLILSSEHTFVGTPRRPKRAT